MIEGGLHQAGLEPGQGEGLHELPDQNVIQVIWNAP